MRSLGIRTENQRVTTACDRVLGTRQIHAGHAAEQRESGGVAPGLVHLSMGFDVCDLEAEFAAADE